MSSFHEAIYQEGDNNNYVFALVEMWGKSIEHERGMRAEFCEIVCFIEPSRPGHLACFPRDGLRVGFPDVPVVRLNELKDVIEDRGLMVLERSGPASFVQWLRPDGSLAWLKEPSRPDGERAVQLPVAARTDGEAITVVLGDPVWVFLDDEPYSEATIAPSSTTYRFVKSSVQDVHGRLYVFWQHADPGEGKGFEEVFSLLQRDPGAMEVHLESPPAEE